MFELTIGEYEDMQVLGTFETENEAKIALADYVLGDRNHQFLHPHITQV